MGITLKFVTRASIQAPQPRPARHEPEFNKIPGEFKCNAYHLKNWCHFQFSIAITEYHKLSKLKEKKKTRHASVLPETETSKSMGLVSAKAILVTCWEANGKTGNSRAEETLAWGLGGLTYPLVRSLLP